MIKKEISDLFGNFNEDCNTGFYIEKMELLKGGIKTGYSICYFSCNAKVNNLRTYCLLDKNRIKIGLVADLEIYDLDFKNTGFYIRERKIYYKKILISS